MAWFFPRTVETKLPVNSEDFRVGEVVWLLDGEIKRKPPKDLM